MVMSCPSTHKSYVLLNPGLLLESWKIIKDRVWRWRFMAAVVL